MNGHLCWQVDDVQEILLTVYNPLLIWLPISKVELCNIDGRLLVMRDEAIRLQPRTKTGISLKVRPREEQTLSIGHVTLYLLDAYFASTVKFDSRGLNTWNTSVSVPESEIFFKPNNLKKPYLIDIHSILVSKRQSSLFIKVQIDRLEDQTLSLFNNELFTINVEPLPNASYS